MAGITLDYTYHYAKPSSVELTDAGSKVNLSTSSRVVTPDLFFRGTLTRPRITADLLLALVRVVQSRFHIPPAMLARILALADPVVTCGEDQLRFEAFSACCGVYGRVDLLPESLDGALLHTGTTNVDFNPPMRAALARLTDSSPAALTVGQSAVELETAGDTVIERKVPLPVRWIKGFVEVQSRQADMDLRMEIGGAEARRFIQSLPRAGTGNQAAWVTKAGGGLRLSMLAGAGGVRVGGVERLRILEDIIRHCRSLRVYSASDGQASGWEVDCGAARFFLVLSADVWRGFSGEGQALSKLTEPVAEETVHRVNDALDWSARIDVGALARSCSLETGTVRAALARLGARGLVGYDLALGSYFRRELPFDLSLVESLQPRLIDARKLVASNGVHITQKTEESIEAYVQGTDCEHHVRILSGEARCTCPWFAKHSGERGPCKHILAVQIMLSGGEDTDVA